jgi:hypothetical protein
VIEDLAGIDELDDDLQAYQTALWEGGYDDGTSFGVRIHDEDDPFYLESDDYLEDEEDDDDD